MNVQSTLGRPRSLVNVRPHVAQNSSARRSAIDKRTTRHSGYAASQRIRKRIEEAFGWIKTVAGLRARATVQPAPRASTMAARLTVAAGPPWRVPWPKPVSSRFRPFPYSATVV